MSTPDDFQDVAPQKQGMNSTAKVLLILGSIAGLCLLVCCGGVAYFVYSAKNAFENLAKNAVSYDPAVIKERTEEIIHIDVPEDYEPSLSLNIEFMGFSMKQIAFHREGSETSVLRILETNQPMQGSPEQQRQQMRQLMRQQAQQQGQIDDEINGQSSETREFKINGESVTFQFIKGTAAQSGIPTREVVGMFRSKNGTVMVMARAPESEYNEEEVVKMVESIRVPERKDAAGQDAGMTGDEPADEEASPPKEDRAEGDSSSESSP